MRPLKLTSAMKHLSPTTLLFLLSSVWAHAESWTGYPFQVESLEETKIEDTGKTVWQVQIKSDDPRKKHLRITFENKTRKVVEVIWMTKGMFALKTPSMGVHLPAKPTAGAKPIIILSERDLKDADYPDIALVNFIWEEPKGTK